MMYDEIDVIKWIKNLEEELTEIQRKLPVDHEKISFIKGRIYQLKIFIHNYNY